MRIMHLLTAITLLAAGTALVGCTNIHGARDDGTRQDGRIVEEYEFDMEVVPNAKLVRVDTAPTWQLGTNGYEPGADRLLIISRTTLLNKDLPKGSSRPKNYVPEMEPRYVERVWITLPGTKQVGEKMDIDQLYQKFLVGYDHGAYGKHQFTKPNRVRGVVTVVEEQANSVTVSLNIGVHPQGATDWSRQGTFTVPIHTIAQIATPAPKDRIFIPQDDEPTMQPKPMASEPAADAAPVEGDAVPALESPAEQPADSSASAEMPEK